MARKINRTGSGDKEVKTATVSKVKQKRADEKTVFRSPHRALSVMVKPCERIDHGAGSYAIVPPKMADFEDRGSYGEIVCDPEVAAVLRQKAKVRETAGLPPKYAEV